MNVLSRGIRNAFRNNIRTFSIILILGLSIGLSLTMLVARASVQMKIEEVKRTVGGTINVTPAGFQNLDGGGEPLTSVELNKIAKLDHIKNVTQSLNDRLTSKDTNLSSAIDPGSLGSRQIDKYTVVFNATNGQNGGNAPSFTPPVMITGVNDLSNPAVYGGDSVTYTSGQAFDATKDELVAVVGKALAEKNKLNVGSTFTAYGKTIKVVGIYDAGTLSANNGLIMPLTTLQRLSNQAGNVTSATVTADSIDNLESVVSAIKKTLGDKADVVSELEHAKQAIEPLESVKTISIVNLVGATGAGAIIILLSMMMVVRERRREIGVFKAIGASNTKIVTQFISEAVTLTTLGLVAGLIIGVVAAAPVTQALVKNSTSSESQTPNFGDGPGAGMMSSVQVNKLGGEVLESAQNIQASVGVEVFAYGIATALVIAIVGSAVPAYLISKVRPAEVMRTE